MHWEWVCAQKNKSRSTFSDGFMGDIQAQLSGVHNTKRYFKDFVLEACFIVELRLVNAQHRAGNRKTKRISEQFIKLRYHLYQKKNGWRRIHNEHEITEQLLFKEQLT